MERCTALPLHSADRQTWLKALGLIVASLMAIVLAFSLTGCADSDEMKQAKSEFTSASDTAKSQIKDIEAAISDTEAMVYGNDRPLDESLVQTTENAISDAKVAAGNKIPSMPGKLEDITAKTKEIKDLNLQASLDAINSAKTNYANSIEQRKLVTAPSEAYVIERLQRVDKGLIDGIAAVTEDHDPNGNLNKSGGYTATVYFSSPLVDQSKVFGDDIIDKGTDGGGAVEVYANDADAKKRRDYLATYDGSIFANGSHTVIGTVLVRTSNNLTASQQKEMEAAVIAALTALN